MDISWEPDRRFEWLNGIAVLLEILRQYVGVKMKLAERALESRLVKKDRIDPVFPSYRNHRPVRQRRVRVAHRGRHLVGSRHHEVSDFATYRCQAHRARRLAHLRDAREGETDRGHA